jgi:hypothetical protein
MKAVCIPQPDASEIARQWRHVLAMEWETQYRGPLLLCAGSRPPEHSPDEGSALPREMALASAVLEDVHPLTEEDLGPAGLRQMPTRPRFSWVFSQVQEIELFSVRERAGIFDIDVEEGELVPLDPVEYEDHLEFFNKVIVPELGQHLGDVHAELPLKKGK